MKKAITFFSLLFFAIGWVSAQDVYFSGNHNGTGKIWKNDTIVHNITDSLNVTLNAMQVSPDGTVYTAGSIFDTEQSIGQIWRNDSILFSVGNNTIINALRINGNDWTAAGTDKNAWDINQGVVWHNGEVLHTFSDSLVPNEIYAICIDTVTGDIYSGGITDTLETAIVWKNDTAFWEAELTSSVCCLYHDGTNLYAGGYYYLEGLLMATLWENGEVLYSFGDSLTSTFQAIDIYDGDIYTAGYADDSVFVWKNGEVLYSHPVNEFGTINALCVNEYGVYYAGHIDYVGIVWKDGEVLYQPEDCEEVTAIVVLPTEPSPSFILTVEADSTGWGTVTGGGVYYYGDTVTIEAFPNPGCEFLMWNDSITDNPRNIVVTQDSTFVAYFSQIDYTITTEVTPFNSGTVTGDGIYHYGDTITLEATANPGFVFEHWNDNVTDNPREVIVTGDQTFIAHFGIQQCLVTTEVTPEGAGSVTGGGIYDYGETITLTAQNNTGYVFIMWDDGETTNPRTVVVEGDTTFTAVFKPLQYEITTECDPVEGGTVSGAGTYDYNSIATLTATPNENYIFLCWSDGIVSNPRSVTVTGNANYKAMFHHNGTPQYTITVTANNPLLGTVTGSGTYPEGSIIEISATPIADAYFAAWDDGNTDNPRSVVVTQDMEFEAIFKVTEVYYTITVRSGNPLLGSTYGSGFYPANQTINIGAVPNTGFHFSGWQDGDMNNPRTITVTGDAEFIAYFSQDPVQTYTVTVHYDEDQGFIIGAGTYTAGSIASIAAIPADGYYFLKWNDNTTDNPREVLVDHDIVLTAFFAITGVDESGLETVSLYPNPANDKIRIEGLEGEHEVQIYNAFGTLVLTTTLQGDSEINICDLPAGYYLIRIDNRHAVRFIKEN